MTYIYTAILPYCDASFYASVSIELTSVFAQGSPCGQTITSIELLTDGLILIERRNRNA